MSSNNTRPTIAIQQVQHILQGAHERGLEVDGVLKRAGIPASLLHSSLSRVTQAQYAALISALRRATRDELWGLCQHPLRIGSFDQACRLLVECKTLGQALRAGLHYYHLLLHDFVPRLVVNGKVATWRLSSNGPRDAKQLYAERSFCFFGYGIASWLVARPIPVLEVIYPVDDSLSFTDAGKLFQAPVHYEQGYVGFRFESRWLDLPVVQSAQSLSEFLRQAPASLLVKYRDQTRLTERIRRLLRKHLSEEMPSLESVSESLAMTPQTLRRRLRDEGQGYQAIKDDLRRDAAIEYLAQPELTLITIANRLGFSEASAFHRAFKGWTGVAPGAYRQNHPNEAN